MARAGSAASVSQVKARSACAGLLSLEKTIGAGRGLGALPVANRGRRLPHPRRRDGKTFTLVRIRSDRLFSPVMPVLGLGGGSSWASTSLLWPVAWEEDVRGRTSRPRPQRLDGLRSCCQEHAR